MPWGYAAVAVGTIAAGSMAANAQENAAENASAAQRESSQQSIAEQRRQFDEMRKLLEPYVNAGSGALGAYQNLAGLGGAGAQQSAIQALQNSPEFAALQQQGENAILANASATGGLRGGNTQAALAQFRPALLSQLINEQYGRLGGLTSLGQNAAAGVGNAGLQTGQGISAALQQIGAANAGNALAQGKAAASQWNSIGNAAGQLGALYAYNQSQPKVGVASGTPTNEVF
jgi:hypothetical protein